MISEFEPNTSKEALIDEEWIKEMEEEIDQIENNATWSLVPRLEHKNVIGTKWVFRNKLNEEGTIVRNKARLVCKGYTQEEGEDYGETFAPMARLEGVRMLLAFATFKGFKVYQMDVKFAFLNGILEEEMYIEQLEGFALSEDSGMVCRLHKALYGLKQAPRAWYERLHSHLVKIGFQRTSEDSNIYLKSEGDQILICEVFVDDIIFGGDDKMSHAFVDEMKEFEISLIGEIKFFIGLQIQQMKEGIFITQSKYVKEVLKTFGMEERKLVSTLMVTGCKLTKEDDSALVNEKEYRSIIGKLHYVVHSRPDIAHAVGIVANFHKSPRESHLVAVKRILRYLKGTDDYGLWYPYNDDYNLKVYIDANWASNVDDQKSTTGGVFFLGGRLVSWTSKKQSCTSQSTAEAEYVVAFMNCTQAIWMKHVLEGFKVPVSKSVNIFCDNTSAINISKNSVLRATTKHIELKYHFLREKVQNKEVVLQHVSSKEQLADIFTKPLPKTTFTYLRGELGVLPLHEVN